ncbi:MAG: hypothetical protein PHQ75_10710 [Thermoguttaceae bacterium]|nr:hypothetical protein [Thermoguttaceae bacterium]
MKKATIQKKRLRFRFLTLMIGLLVCTSLVLASSGCSTFKGKKKEVATEKEKTAFDTAREEHANLGEYVASAGRKDPKEKKEVDPGQTFLLSDKAKEIYRNTER